MLTLALFSGAVDPSGLSRLWRVAGAGGAGRLIVRKPGAAVFGEVVAAAVSAILGSASGMDAILRGAIQGAGAEWSSPYSCTAPSPCRWRCSLVPAPRSVDQLHDMPIYYPDLAFGVQLAIGAFMLVSGAIIAGLGSWLLVRAPASGVLAASPSGR